MKLGFGTTFLLMSVLASQALPASAEDRRPGSAQINATARAEASRLGRELARNPSRPAARASIDRFYAKNPHGNINELVFLVMRAAVEEMNEDKKYFASKLKTYNEMGRALSDYLDELQRFSTAIGRGQMEVDAGMASLLRANRSLDAAIARTEAGVSHTPDVAKLRESLEHDRRVIAVARTELRPVPATTTPPPKSPMNEPRRLPTAEPAPPEPRKVVPRSLPKPRRAEPR